MGVAGLISKKRGRPSNRRTATSVRAAALWIVRHNYADFGPTLAAEKLASEHGFAFSSETLRKWNLQFVESESTFAYFHAARAYLEAWGKPVAFYSDKHGVFRVNHPGALGGDGMTQFGRALHALNVDIICAQFEPGQRAGRARSQDLAGPVGQGIATGRGAHPGRRQRPAPHIHR